MARIDRFPNDWRDGDTINAREYKQEREMIQLAVNDNQGQIDNRPTRREVEEMITSTGDGVALSIRTVDELPDNPQESSVYYLRPLRRAYIYDGTDFRELTDEELLETLEEVRQQIADIQENIDTTLINTSGGEILNNISNSPVLKVTNENATTASGKSAVQGASPTWGTGYLGGRITGGGSPVMGAGVVGRKGTHTNSVGGDFDSLRVGSNMVHGGVPTFNNQDPTNLGDLGTWFRSDIASNLADANTPSYGAFRTMFKGKKYTVNVPTILYELPDGRVFGGDVIRNGAAQSAANIHRYARNGGILPRQISGVYRCEIPATSGQGTIVTGFSTPMLDFTYIKEVRVEWTSYNMGQVTTRAIVQATSNQEPTGTSGSLLQITGDFARRTDVINIENDYSLSPGNQINRLVCYAHVASTSGQQRQTLDIYNITVVLK